MDDFELNTDDFYTDEEVRDHLREDREEQERLKAEKEAFFDEDDPMFDEDDEEESITIYGDPKSFSEIQKHLEAEGFEIVSAEFTYIPNDLKEVTAEQRETIDKMIERLEDFDDVQNVYTNMKPEEA